MSRRNLADAESLEIFTKLVRKIFDEKLPGKEYPELAFEGRKCLIGKGRQFTQEEKDKILSSLSEVYTSLNPAPQHLVEEENLYGVINPHRNPITSVNVDFIKSLTLSIATLNSLVGLADANVSSVAKRRTIGDKKGVILHRFSASKGDEQLLFATNKAFFTIDEDGTLQQTNVDQPAVQKLLSRSMKDIEDYRAECLSKLSGATSLTSKPSQEAGSLLPTTLLPPIKDAVTVDIQTPKTSIKPKEVVSLPPIRIATSYK